MKTMYHSSILKTIKSVSLFSMYANYKLISWSTAYAIEPSIWLYCQDTQADVYTDNWMCIHVLGSA